MENESISEIFKLVPGDLNHVDFHQAVSSIQRLVPEKFPLHLAVHSVLVEDKNPPKVYSAPHMHTDQDEVNILISKSSMVYNIMLDDEEHEVAAPATIWIPAGKAHSANVVSGEGFFICIRFEKGPVSHE